MGLENNDLLEHLEQMSGAGLETVESSDSLQTRLKILQPLSPEVLKGNPRYVEGCCPGDIFDSASQMNFGTSINYMPIVYRKTYNEWKPRGEKNSLVAVHRGPSAFDLLRTCSLDRKKRIFTPEGNEIVETANFYGMLILENGTHAIDAFISMWGTGLTPARQIIRLSKINRVKGKGGRSFIPPLYYQSYKMTTKFQQNDSGAWHGWIIQTHKTIQELSRIEGTFITGDFLKDVKAIQEGASNLFKPEIMATVAMIESGNGEKTPVNPPEGDDTIPL